MPKKRKIIYIALLLLIFVLAFYFFLQKYLISDSNLKKIDIKGKKFTVEIADTPEKQAKGLGERENLCKDCGMLFEFQKKGKQSFWMKGMEFDLDILWIDGDRIVYMAKSVSYDSKETITPDTPSDRVLEINSGISDKLGIKVGDRIKSE